MNEVEKLYSLAGVEPDYDYFTLFDDKVHKIGRTMHLCKKELKHWLENYQKDYVAIKVIRVDKECQPFTIEKQLELIKWLSKRRLLNIAFSNDKNTYQLFNDKCTGSFCSDLATAIVTLVQCELDFCTKEEKQQIKEILNG